MVRDTEGVRQELANALLEIDPGFARFMTRSPSYRYWHTPRGALKHNSRMYCFTTEPARGKNNRMRYASWVWRVQGAKFIAHQMREHAKRKDARARAYALFEAQSP